MGSTPSSTLLLDFDMDSVSIFSDSWGGEMQLGIGKEGVEPVHAELERAFELWALEEDGFEFVVYPDVREHL